MAGSSFRGRSRGLERPPSVSNMLFWKYGDGPPPHVWMVFSVGASSSRWVRPETHFSPFKIL